MLTNVQIFSYLSKAEMNNIATVSTVDVVLYYKAGEQISDNVS
jgi:hypothetical protein